MASSSFIPIFVTFLVLVSSVIESRAEEQPLRANQTFRPGEELQKLRRIKARLRKINRPSVKTIQAFSFSFSFSFFLHFSDIPFCFGVNELDSSSCRVLMEIS